MVNEDPGIDLIISSGLAEFTRDIRLGKFERSYDVAKRTIEIIIKIIKSETWTQASLCTFLKGVCNYLNSLNLVDTAVGNLVRRTMRIVRDECHTDQFAHENILEGIEQELMNELDLSSRSIAQQAIDYVQSDEIILTLGRSRVVEKFFRYAATGGKRGRRKFTVIVVELAPFYNGHEMAKALNKIGISTLIVPDSAVFAIMSRVNKVLLSTHSMMANGGIKAPAGAHSIALAAKHYAVPLIVCCPMYKLTPSYLVSHDTEAFEQFSNLHAAFPEPYTSPTATGAATPSTDSSSHQQQHHIQPSKPRGSLESIHSTFDYIPPELITLFVSNIGGNSPSYVYQLLNELYCKSDYLD